VQFKEWFYEDEMYLMELLTLDDRDLSSVNLRKTVGPVSDDEAEDHCDDQANEEFKREMLYDPLYDEYELDGELPNEEELPYAKKWLQENPEPDQNSPEHDEWYDKYEAMMDDALDTWREKKIKYDRKKRSRLQQLRQICFDNLPDNDDFIGYESTFEHGNHTYIVEFEEKTSSLAGKNIKNVYQVSFTGPRGFYLTGASGPEAMAIYTKMLLAIKKLIATVRVDGLTYSPAQVNMIPIYDRFFKTFAKEDFVRIDKTVILKKDVFNRIISGLSPSKRETILSQIKSELDLYANAINAAKKTKEYKRNIARRQNEFIGKFVPILSRNADPVLLLRVDLGSNQMYVLNFNEYGFYVSQVGLDNLAIPTNVLPEITSQKQLNNAMNAVDFSNIDLIPVLGQARLQGNFDLPTRNWHNNIPALLQKLSLVLSTDHDTFRNMSNGAWFASHYPEAYASLKKVFAEYGMNFPQH